MNSVNAFNGLFIKHKERNLFSIYPRVCIKRSFHFESKDLCWRIVCQWTCISCESFRIWACHNHYSEDVRASSPCKAGLDVVLNRGFVVLLRSNSVTFRLSVVVETFREFSNATILKCWEETVSFISSMTFFKNIFSFCESKTLSVLFSKISLADSQAEVMFWIDLIT